MKTRLIDEIIDAEILEVPQKFRGFIRLDADSQGWSRTLNYYGLSYAAAFEELAETFLQNRGRREYLKIPLFYLCRHSVELSIRSAMKDLHEAGFSCEEMSGHNLLALWEKFQSALKNTNLIENDDEWSEYCGRLIKHIHDFDPRGENFRYPVRKNGIPFSSADIEISHLIKAHFKIYGYCGAVGIMTDYLTDNH